MNIEMVRRLTNQGARTSGDALRWRILLVEDDGDLREALGQALTDSGHDVIMVQDGEQALAAMRRACPDVVVLDLMMPVMDGWQFRVHQRRDPALAETPVVAISASRSPMAAAVDADMYLQKPLDTRTLLGAIEDVLRARARRQEHARVMQTERMAALGTLAAGVAHEINNPLTYVLLYLTNLARLLPGLATADSARGVEHLETLVRGALEGAERIRGITNGIRTFSRVDDRRRAPLDLRTVLDGALQLLMHEIRHRARLTRDYREAPPVLANEGGLGQVFLNLLTNAVQALPEGDAGAHEIRVATGTDDDGDAVVEIADTGPGIPEHVLGRVFEPFFSTKPVGQGTGLGLSISHGIVTSLGGEIGVTSVAGRGTTFRVVLPAARQARAVEVAAHAPPALAARAASARRRVLVIDDEPSVCAAIQAVLEDAHEVHLAVGGREALALLASDPRFDAILCDLHMPELTGMELYERLHASRPALAERMIFTTAGAFTERARAFLAAGAHPFLEKPLDVDRLHALLARPPR